ncbi:MAG: NACHT domain-containing protein [Spirulina sp.]
MAKRSLSLSSGFTKAVRGALAAQGLTQEELANMAGVSRASVVKFLAGHAVDRSIFVRCCSALGIDWEEASAEEALPMPSLVNVGLVQSIRANVYSDIKARCGTMRVLDMEQPIGLGDIYTSVNILEKISGRRRLGLEDLRQDYDPENFDRFLLSQVRHKRIPGLQAVEEHRQLMILGKPGAGKTTFMKRLAILCNEGEFQPQRVPVFVTLKEYAEAEGRPKLQTFIQNQWKACGVKESDTLEAIFKAGHALVLLDGLDEVQENDHARVLQDIKTFTQQFRDCQCVMTCRIAAREYIFETFTEVEVADFNQDQIAEFATKWFTAKQDTKKAETFIQRLEANEPIQELATNPLLLTLLCLVFGEAADFPANRAELYKEGLDVLLKKWDGKRNIERDQIYKKLSLKRKEDLLSQLAFETFERGNYFFKQAVVEQHIIRYIRNLPGASEDEEALQLDSEAILKAIEAQHSLLVERARGIYSFSHIVFQEFFTAQHIVSPTKTLNQALKNLATHITERRYREIFFLTAGMLPEADTLLLLMKQQIDQIMRDDPTKDPNLQDVLSWTQQKTLSAKTPYKPAAIRAFYYALDLGLDVDLALDLDLTLDLDFDRAEQAAASNPELKLKIQALRVELPSRDDREAFEQWWLTNGKNWAERLRTMMIEHRDIGHDWQFSGAQQEKLRQYYEANKLLVECLNSDCYVTKATRQYIEDTLLLPLSEIEKYPFPDALANLYPTQSEIDQ